MCPLCLWVEGLRPEKLRDLFKITATFVAGPALEHRFQMHLLFKHSFLNVCL